MSVTVFDDNFYMSHSLKLAKKAHGWTSPNPMVGAVIVKNGKIIGQGFHRRAGAPHAEVEALKSVRISPKGATLYVNLEPCAHHGKTPPCTDAIIRSGIKKVICATLDPNKAVHGRGIHKMEQAGITVQTGLKAQEARLLNEAFFTFHEKKHPFVAIKFAASLDGKLATYTSDSKWVTNEKARKYARNLRAEYQAILVGVNTVLHDDPHLGARQVRSHDPLRIILDSKLRISPDAQILRDTNVLVATTTQAPRDKRRLLEQKGVSILSFEGMDVPVLELMRALQERDIISILVEGGGAILGSFIDAAMVDKVYAFYAPLLIGGAQAISIGGTGARKVSDALRLDTISIKQLNDNFFVTGYPAERV